MATKNLSCYVVFLLINTCITIVAQTPTELQQNSWHYIKNRAVSDDGLWTYFTTIFDSGNTEGSLQNSQTQKKYVTSSAGKFYLDSSNFFILDITKTLQHKDLKNGNESTFENIADFAYDSEFKTLLMKSNTQLDFLQLVNKKIQKFLGITKFENIPGTPCTLLFSDEGVQLLNRSVGFARPLIEKGTQLISYIANSDRKSINLLVKMTNGYKVQEVDYKGNFVGQIKEINFSKDFSSFSFLSENIVIGTKPSVEKNNKNNDTVEVWSSRDKALKPSLMNRSANAESIELININGSTMPTDYYTGYETDYYLIFNDTYILEISDLYNYDFKINDLSPSPKIRLKNRHSGKIEMEVDQVQEVYPSLKREYLLYFKDGNWYAYKVVSRETTNITGSCSADFYKHDRLNTLVPLPVDSPRFSSDYSAVYLTSKYDIWKYDLQENNLSKLTDDPEKKIAFRIKESLEGAGVKRMKWNNNPILKNDYLLLQMTNDESGLQEGLAIWRNNALTIIEHPALHRIDQHQKSRSAVSYVLQNANHPPKLINYQLENNEKTVIHDSNPTKKRPNFPKTELRKWVNNKGEETYTTVVLPPCYSPDKKYPAIVRVYENEAALYKNFEYPSYHNPTGFNRALMAMEGYIVILPRITYSQNQVGTSALQAVEETVKKVQSWYAVDTNNIGIIGHSFGGYETNYILTQSSIFKTAVSGSGIADIISDYFTVHKMYHNSNISRYTNEQFGFADGFFSLKNEYLQNNPILMADQIKTPLLLWSGNKDEHVEWRQSVEMFMALSSLKKEVRLLLFPDDAHVLVKSRNQTEATEKIMQWFNYYLKNGKEPAWF